MRPLRRLLRRVTEPRVLDMIICIMLVITAAVFVALLAG